MSLPSLGPIRNRRCRILDGALLYVVALALGCANGLEPTVESDPGSGAGGPGSGGLGGSGAAGAGTGGATSSASTTSASTSTTSASSTGAGASGGATASSASSGPASSSAGVGGAGGVGGSGVGGSGGGCPTSPTNVSGCASCGACDAPWNVTWSPTAGATHYIVEYTCFVAHQYQTMNTVADLCTEVGMCDDSLCANGAGPVTVKACNGGCCSPAVQVPPSETPIACGGGVCC